MNLSCCQILYSPAIKITNQDVITKTELQDFYNRDPSHKLHTQQHTPHVIIQALIKRHPTSGSTSCVVDDGTQTVHALTDTTTQVSVASMLSHHDQHYPLVDLETVEHVRIIESRLSLKKYHLL